MPAEHLLPVFLGPGRQAGEALDLLHDAAARARCSAGDAGAAIDAALALGPRVPLPGSGQTLLLWEVLATLGAADLTAARVVEPHLDALAILAQDGSEAPPGGSWGVFAAEAGGVRLEATEGAGGWRLSGRKPWCSLGAQLSHAVVTAHLADGGRRAFAVDLRQAGVAAAADGWISRGLSAVRTQSLDFDGADAVPVGPAGWYLDRPGFAWGGMGVAACWYGGAASVARRLLQGCLEREPDQLALAALGRVDTALHGARTALAEAADAVDAGEAAGTAGAVLAYRTRGTVHAAAELVLQTAAHNLGPAPLAFEEEHARCVADLQIYLRQYHGARDLAALGRMLLSGPGEKVPW
ncbi:acyl-CoA dehydrogenase [Arthrobacter sp. I2-34]|uniref:Acyl-CoA dehydrogenase n=1 Tax=Arthrobacter hankyongi TaxID=2904801 RepID=A0ABS9LCA6_9MICC|nr:acyl-CoA dehydrogenase [Arthrobacter hankyongi]MCG2624305.1 acyl-CoA dehydrogenase [Arthrobacter hankyongi]